MLSSLSEDQTTRIRSLLQSGKYPSESAVVDAALEMLERRQSFQEFVELEIDSVDRGELVDGQTAFEQLRAELSSLEVAAR